ncbi:hypothetical protein [Streptosporangium longisporum]|uniref:hypothetical protein n=1 Tax=Streptosporangium longisporum TaxID=46187 RepID=UPI0031E8B856
MIAIFTLAHLWAHATAPHEDHHAPHASAQVWACCAPCSHEHHDQVAHPDAFVVPVAAAGAPVRSTAVLARLTGAVSAPPPPGVRGRSARAPPRGHRARAVRTHTLEVYRP